MGSVVSSIVEVFMNKNVDSWLDSQISDPF